MSPVRQRAVRGSQQITREGIDRATRKPRLFTRFTVHGKRHHVRLEATNMEDAREERQERIKAAREGRPFREAPKPPVVGFTIRDLATKFCGVVGDEDEEKFKTGAGADTRDPVHYRRQFWSVLKCHVLPRIGGMPAAGDGQVERRDIKAMRQALLDSHAHPRKVQKAMAATSKLFNWAIDDEELIDRTNPCVRIKKPKTTSSTEFYTTDEVARLLAKAAEKMPQLHPIVAFAFYTGCRKGEIAAVQWRDVDFEGARILVQRSWKSTARKGGKAVTVIIHPHLDAILRAHHKAQKPTEPNALLFPGRYKGSMRGKFNLWGLGELVTLAKVRHFKMPWHSFRHGYATELANTGATLLEIKDALGQSTLQMASTYTNLAADHMRKRIEALPSLGPVLPSKVASLHVHKKDRRSVGRR